MEMVLKTVRLLAKHSIVTQAEAVATAPILSTFAAQKAVHPVQQRLPQVSNVKMEESGALEMKKIC